MRTQQQNFAFCAKLAKGNPNIVGHCLRLLKDYRLKNNNGDEAIIRTEIKDAIHRDVMKHLQSSFARKAKKFARDWRAL